LPNSILKQIPGLRKALRKLPVRIVRIKGEEADDIIALYCRAKWLKGHRIIVSGDEDFLQLVSKKVSMFVTKKDTLYTHKNFKKLIGCKASRWVDVKAMQGDSSDKIPGIGGIGRVYAIRIMEKYKSIEQAMASMGDPDMSTAIKNLLQKVQDNWNIVVRNRKLMDLKEHSVKVGKKNIKIGHWDTTKFKKWCLKRGFKSIRMQMRKYAKIMTAMEKRSSG
jgi:DNA polymerase-1